MRYLTLLTLLHACGASPGASMQLTSTDFVDQGSIPRALTCEGGDRAPALSWSGAPAGTRAFALIIDDPDAPDPAAPKLTWVHWVLYNIPADADGIPAGGEPLPAGTQVGKNDWKKQKYGGPCPPVGRHRYFHRLYALDAPLPDLGAPTRAQLDAAMKGHILAEATLMGTYQKGSE